MQTVNHIPFIDIITAQKMKLSIKDLVTFTEEILNRKFYFLCSEWYITVKTITVNSDSFSRDIIRAIMCRQSYPLKSDSP